MFQSPFEMENGHNDGINMSTMHNLQMIPFDDNDPEVIARRLKNRERQRRYRARKRQEADMKKACLTSQPVQLQVVDDQNQIVNDTPVNTVTRVYSQRNWKKDARRAHLLKQKQQEEEEKEKQENVASFVSANMDMQITGNQLNANLDSREHSSTPSGRNWKAEARNKRN